jgi:hypothetical protein
MQLEQNFVASRTPGHAAGGCGACQRRTPTGGAAKGIPLKATTVVFALTAPCTFPYLVVITLVTGPACIAELKRRAIAKKKPEPNLCNFMECMFNGKILQIQNILKLQQCMVLTVQNARNLSFLL